MRSLTRLALVAGATVAIAAPAAATQFTYVFDSHTGTGGNLSGSGRLTSTLPGGISDPGLQITGYSAWTAVQSGSTVNISAANLVAYDGGLGVVGAYDSMAGCGGAGGCNMHQIDNVGNTIGSKAYDFVQFTFSKAVTLVGMSRYAFAQTEVSPNVYDDDASFGSGATLADIKLNNTSRTSLTPITGATTMTMSKFSTMLGNTLASGDSTAGNGSNADGSCKNNKTMDGASVCYDSNTWATTSNLYTASTTWWISAALLNPDNKADAFKLYDFKVVFNDAPGAVPEPASWMTMIAGFGFVGTALRRKQAAKRLAIA